MTIPDFKTAEELQAYLAGVDQQKTIARRSHARVALWKYIPFVIGAFVVGGSVATHHPDFNTSTEKVGNQKQKVARKTLVESFLQWIGADIDGFQNQKGYLPKFEPLDLKQPQSQEYANFGS